MTVSDRECPATSVLESIAQGAPAAPETEAHIARCPRCSEYLALARFSLRFGAVLGGDSAHAPQPEGSPSIHGYRIKEEIARGGQGVVYRAEQTLTGKTVAIKVLHSVSNATARARLHREMQIIAALDHPVIVRLLDSVRLSDGREALVMEHISGVPITQWADQYAPDLVTRLRVLAEVAEGLHHAHERGVVHRDLTPSNILIDHTGRPRLLDFGVARLIAGDTAQFALTRTGEFTGTLAYSAPEQVSGEIRAADARSDIYSLGVIGYRILSGEMPYPVDGPLDEVIRSITGHEPPPRSRSGLGADPWTVLRQAMQKDPKRRYQTASAFAQDLRSSAEGRAIEARASSPLYRLSIPMRRHRKPIVAAALVLATAAVLVAVSSKRIDRTERARARSELATLLATGSRERAESLLWTELERLTPALADPLDLMWHADYDTRSLVWAFAQMQSEALCLAADHSFQSPPVSITALDSGEFAVIASDRTVYRVRGEVDGMSVVAGPQLDAAIRFARFVPDRDWIVGVTATEVQVLDSTSGRCIASRAFEHPPELAGLTAHSDTAVVCGVSGSLEVFSLPDLRLVATLPGISGGQSDWIDPEEPIVWFIDESGALCSYRIDDSRTTVHDFRVPVPLHQYVAEIQIIPSRGMAVIAHAGKVLAAPTDGPASAQPIVLHSGYRVNLGLSSGSRVLSGQSMGDSTLRLWDIETWQPAGALSGHSGSVLHSAISMDGRRCLSADSAGTLRLWALPGGDWRTDLSDQTATVQDLDLFPDGSRAILPAGMDGVRTVEFQSEETATALIASEFPVARTVLHPEGHLFAATDLGRSVWVRSLNGDSTTDTTITLDALDTIVAARFSPISDHLYIATQSGDLIEIDPASKSVTRRNTVASEGRVSDLVISPDGLSMALCTRGGSLVLIDPVTLSPTRTERLSEKQLRALSFDPTGIAVYCVGDTGGVQRYDLRKNAVTSSELISQASLFEVAVHPEGHTLAVGDRNGIVRLIDAATLQPLCKLQGSGSVMALKFTPDGERLVVSCLEQPPQVWDLAQLVSPLSAIRPVRER